MKSNQRDIYLHIPILISRMICINILKLASLYFQRVTSFFFSSTVKDGIIQYFNEFGTKNKKEKETKIQIQEKLIKSLRNVTTKYKNAANANITVIDIGRKTGLYKELKSIIGRH